MKQNDWLVANLNNPNFTAGDFKYISGMTLENTQFLPEEEYLKSNFIKTNSKFIDKDGNFSEDLFHKAYSESSEKFNDFSSEEKLDNYEYNMWDVMRPKKGKIKNPNFELSKQKNPDHIKIGIEGFNKVSNSSKSRRELAQDSKIYDPSTGEYLNESVNDISLFQSPLKYIDSLISDPIIYATYDEDTIEIDPITNKEIVHKKGEWKVNEKGEYYTEKLNGRSLIGKEVVSFEDYLTPENSEINKYDFFDSDDLEKSASGIIAKNVASVIPMFIPVVNKAYAGLLVARELSKTAPMLYGMVQSFTGNEENYNSKFANTMAAYGNKFSGTTSDYAKQKLFSFENFGNLMSDVALQWGQQRFIAEAFQKLTLGSEKALETAQVKALNEYKNQVNKAYNKVFNKELSESTFIKQTGVTDVLQLPRLLESGQWASTMFGQAALNKYLPAAQRLIQSRNKIGQDLSLVYMALVSNTDVYDSVLEKGGTPFEAASIALGSTIGMFSVDKYLGLGEMFFTDDVARKGIRQAVTENANKILDNSTKKIADASTKEGIIEYIKRGIKSGKDAIKNYHGKIKDRSLGFVGKSLGEGLEEVSEELVTDLSKTLGEMAGKFGLFSQTDYGAWENMVDRYLMSFLGGAAGGGLFYGVDIYQNGKAETDEFQNNIIYLLRQNYKKDILKELNSQMKKGKLGSKHLSYKDPSVTVTDEKESQNYYVYKTLKNMIEQMDLILNENQINLSDDELFDKMVQGEYRFQALTDFLKGDKEDIKDISYISKYQEDFQELSNKIINKESEIKALANSTDDPEKRNNPDYKNKLDNLNKELQELREYKDYLFGEGSLGYVEKMLFAMDSNLSGNLISLNLNQLSREIFGKSLNELSEQEKKKLKEINEQLASKKKLELDDAFKLFKKMQEQINPEIQSLDKFDLNKFQEKIEEINAKNPIFRSISLSNEVPSPNESEEEFAKSFQRKENETDEEFEKRKQEQAQKRIKEKEKYNQENFANWMKELTSQPIDRNTFRDLKARLKENSKSLIDSIIDSAIFSQNKELQFKIQTLLKNTENYNKDEILQKVKDIIKEEVSNQFDKAHEQLESTAWANIPGVIKSWIKTMLALSDEDKNKLGIPLNYDLTRKENGEYNDEIPLTRKDFYYFLKYYINFLRTFEEDPKPNLQINDIERISIYLVKGIEGFTLWDDLIEYYGEAGLRESEGLDNLIDDEIIEVTKAYRDKTIENAVDTQFTEISEILEQAINLINNDPSIQSMRNLESSQFINNPIIPVLSKISTKLRSESENYNIEQTLEEIYNQFISVENPSEFQLSDNQIKLLDSFLEDFKMAVTFIRAASENSQQGKPIGHNKTINSFVRNHKDIFKKFEELPEIDQNVGQFLIHEIEGYAREIDSWKNLSKQNESNNLKNFIKAGEALNNTLLTFYSINRDAFKLDSLKIDLLEGIDDLDLSNKNIALIKIQKLLHDNFVKLQDKFKLEDILNELLPKIIKLDNLKEQRTSRIDENLNYSKFTDYDIFTYILTTFAVDDFDFYNNLKQFIENNENLIPLILQEYASKVAYAQQNNPNLIKKALKYVHKKLGLKIPMFSGTIASGLGGSGKTFALTKLSLNDGENTWSVGPEQSQVNNLQKNLTKSKGYTKEELIKLILGTNAEEFLRKPVLKKIGKYEKYRQSEFVEENFYKVIEGLEKASTIQLKDINKFITKLKDAPKTIVIDEATHFSTAELLLISKFCDINHIKLLTLGDEHQNGYSKDGLMGNIEYTRIFAWRTPKLFISLRDNNIQKSNNLYGLIRMIDKFEDTSTPEQTNTVTNKLFNDDFKNFRMTYYNEDKFTGELVTDKISSDLLNKLNGTIGFIGDESSSFFKQLKEAGKTVELVDPLSVQGREYDYTIVDKEWKTNFDESNIKYKGIDLYNFLKDLYTMISRSRFGTILIDNNLSDVIKCVQENSTGVSSNKKEAIKQSRKIRLKQLDEILEYLKENSEQNKKSDNSDNNDDNNSDNNEDNNVNKDDNDGDNNKDDNDNDDNGNNDNNDDNDNVNNDDEIKGTEIKIKDIHSEESSSENNESDNEGEFEDSKNQDTLFISNQNYPIRVYANVSHSGIDTSGDIWENPDNRKSNLGIFLNSGETIESGDNKHALVKKLIDTKSIICYGTTYYDRLDKSIKDVFSEEAFDNAKYYISVEDASNYNRLVGLTDLDNDKREIQGKVITLVVKIKNRNGEECSVTLGALANPQTWEDNKSKIIKDLNKLIEDEVEDSDKLKEYINNLDSNILDYKNKIKELVKKNQEFEIDKPNFSGLTSLIKLPNAERLENINSNERPYDSKCQYAVVSRVYTNIADIEGIRPKRSTEKIFEEALNKKIIKLENGSYIYVDKNMSLGKTKDDVINKLNNNKEIYDEINSKAYPLFKGKPVMFVSSNSLLNPDELEQMYINQKSNPNLVPQVRMVVLNNLGVSFESLWRKKYKDIYVVKKGKITYTTPFMLEPMAVRMYISMWNFRSNLKRFLDAYNKWINKSNLSEDKIEELCKSDNEQYNKYNEQYRKEIKDKKAFLSEKEYRKRLENNDKSTFDKLTPIWTFNDNLKNYREFRLGYNSQNGAYIRKLTNLVKGDFEFYKKPDNTLGIYINPKLARQYDSILDFLFNTIINKIVEIEDKDPLIHIDDKLSKGWFEKVRSDRSIDVDIQDYNKGVSDKITTLNFKSGSVLSSLPIILIELVKYCNIRALDVEKFNEKIFNQQNAFSIKIGDEKIKWTEILGLLDGGQQSTSTEGTFVEGSYPPGIRPYKISKDKNKVHKTGIVDKRIDNLFSLMFHGLISTSKENDFTRGDICATDAKFKYGFLSDPILVAEHSGDDSENKNVLSATNDKLYSANAVPGFPIIGISLSKKSKSDNVIKQNTSETNTQNVELEELKVKIKNELKNFGINLSNKVLKSKHNFDDLFDLVQTKIKTNFDNYINNIRNTDVNKFKNMIIEVKKQDDKTIKYVKLIEYVGLNEEEIQDAKFIDGVLTVKTVSGKEYTIQNINGKFIKNEIIKANLDKITAGQLKLEINEKLKILDKLINLEWSNDDINDLKDNISEVLNNNLGSTSDDGIVSNITVNSALGKVLNMFDTEITADTEEEANIFKEFRSELESMTKTDCDIIK